MAGGTEHGEGGEEAARETVRAIAYEGDHLHVGPRRELGQCIAVQELACGEPLVHGHRLALQLGDDAQPAADTKKGQPEKGP